MAMLQSLNCVPKAIADNPRYVGDHVIRAYRYRTIQELFADLGEPCPEMFEVSGGIGTLKMTKTGNTYVPAIKDHAALEPRAPLSADCVASRLLKCQGCTMYSESADKCNMCGCGGQMQRINSPWASCPKGLWNDQVQ